ncbi:MAG: DNA-binding response regulator, partial [Polyangia bacterium]
MLILIVDDDEPTAFLHRRALELAGHHVVVASGVADARHCLGELVFDAVLPDFNLAEKENGSPP